MLFLTILITKYFFAITGNQLKNIILSKFLLTLVTTSRIALMTLIFFFTNFVAINISTNAYYFFITRETVRMTGRTIFFI